MQATKVERYKKQLLEEKARLVDDLNQSSEAIAEDTSAPGDLSSVPTHAADHDTEGLDVEIAASSTESQILDQVNEALERIEEGTYGKCEDCGGEIQTERLDVVPHTPYCATCQRQHENE